MTINKSFLSFAKKEIDMRSKVPNKITLEAHQEALKGSGTAYESMDDFCSDM